MYIHIFISICVYPMAPERLPKKLPGKLSERLSRRLPERKGFSKDFPEGPSEPRRATLRHDTS